MIVESNQNEYLLNGDTRADPGQQGEDDGVDFAHLFGVLLKDKWLILAVVMMAMPAASVHLFGATPVYKVDALVQVENETETSKGLERLSALFGKGLANRRTGDHSVPDGARQGGR